MSSQTTPMAELSLIGGTLCLDFANTVDRRHGDDWGERLTEYADLVWWSVRVGELSPSGAEALLSVARSDPAEAAHVFRRAIELRESIYRVFSAAADGHSVQAADLDVLNTELARAMSRARMVRSPDGYVWGWEDSGELDRVLWPVARSAADLLTSAELGRVGECAGDECNWLFLDTSKNRSRRWCDMKGCGNRAKVRRHYRRHRGEERSSE